MAVRHHLCGKRVFKNLKGAKRRAAELRESTDRPFRAYSCNFCGYYHLTTKSIKQVFTNIGKRKRQKLQKIKHSLKSINHGNLDTRTNENPSDQSRKV